MDETREREGGISNFEIIRKLLSVAVKWLCRVTEYICSVNLFINFSYVGMNGNR